jgi:hypothetical protein
VALVGIVCFFLVVQSGLDDQVEMLYLDDSVSSRVTEIYDEYLAKIKPLGYITIMTALQVASVLHCSAFGFQPFKSSGCLLCS